MMNVETTKLELMHLLLQTQKKSVLARIQKVFEEEQVDFVLNEEQYQILDERRAAHLNEESESYSWKQVKQDARNTSE